MWSERTLLVTDERSYLALTNPCDIDLSLNPNLFPTGCLLPHVHRHERRFPNEMKTFQESLEEQDDLGDVIFKKFPAKGEV